MNSLYESNALRHFPPVTKFELHRGNCLTGMAKLPNESFDLAVTSPPYNLGIRYGSYADGEKRGAFLDWCMRWAAEVRRLLKPDGSFFLNVGATPSNPMLPHEMLLRFREFFVLQNTIHWIKSIALEERTHGHFKPLRSPRYLNDCHEYVFHLTKSGAVKIDRLALGVPYQHKSNIARWRHTGGSDLRCRGNTWFVPYETIKSRAKDRPHPATFPVALVANCIKLHGLTSGLSMLDPFLGIGNSALAAKECGVERFVGFEIDRSYLTEARRRVRSSTGVGVTLRTSRVA